MESKRGLQILDLTRFLDANRSPPRIKSGAGFRLKTLWAHQLANLFKSGEGSCQIGPENL
jgi:hypothetical protein